MRIGTIVVAVVGLFLPGLALGQDLAEFDPSLGVGGFVGPMEELDRPIALRWRPREGIVGTVETVSMIDGLSTERVVTVFTGAVTASSENGLSRRFAVSELTVNGRSVTATEPLVIVESRSDDQGGNVADLAISFPGFAIRGMPAPVPGTPQYQLWRDLFAADLAYAAAPVSAGGEIFDRGSYHRLLESQVVSVLGRGDVIIRENTFATVARGIVREGSRLFLLAQLTGRIEAQAGENQLTMETQGYGLIDLASGLSTGTSKTEIIARQAGREATRTVFVDVNLLQ